MKAVKISPDYKREQKEETQKEVNNLLSSGMEQISLNEFQEVLKPLGLNFKFGPDNEHKYYNTLNEQAFLHCSNDPVCIKTGHSWANINSEFYKDEIQRKSLKHERFKEIRNQYFAVLKSGHILHI